MDLTDSAFSRNGFGNRRGIGRRNFENPYFALQDAEDSTQFRTLIGENTHIFSREDNLSSGNLPTVNRSLILEEHNGAGIFGTEFGIEYGMALSPQYSIALAALDNRGALNKDRPQYSIGNSRPGSLPRRSPSRAKSSSGRGRGPHPRLPQPHLPVADRDLAEPGRRRAGEWQQALRGGRRGLHLPRAVQLSGHH